MPPRIPDTKREAIANDIRAGGQSTRAIAAAHAVSDHAVRKIAKEHGLEGAWSRAQTENATRARVADMASRRASLASALLDDVDRLRERAWSRYSYYERGADGPVLVTTDLPPLDMQRNAYTSMGIVLDKHLALVKHDSASGAETVGSLLGSMMDELIARHGDSPTG